jgi:hypothetical protein
MKTITNVNGAVETQEQNKANMVALNCSKITQQINEKKRQMTVVINGRKDSNFS